MLQLSHFRNSTADIYRQRAVNKIRGWEVGNDRKYTLKGTVITVYVKTGVSKKQNYDPSTFTIFFLHFEWKVKEFSNCFASSTMFVVLLAFFTIVISRENENWANYFLSYRKAKSNFPLTSMNELSFFIAMWRPCYITAKFRDGKIGKRGSLNATD